jgi:hypothetical protein
MSSVIFFIENADQTKEGLSVGLFFFVHHMWAYSGALTREEREEKRENKEENQAKGYLIGSGRG